MAFTKKQNRRLVIGDKTYVWYLNGNYAWDRSRQIAVRDCQSLQGQLLLIDHWAHDFEIRPRMIRDAIVFASVNGWRSKEKAAPMYLGFDNVQFLVLSKGERHTPVFQHPPSANHSVPHVENQ